MTAMKFGFGHAVRRVEDSTLLRGAGRYVPDHAPEGVLHAVVLRSPHAHAKFRIGNADAVRALPGVRLLLTGEETKSLGPLPCLAAPPEVSIEAPPYGVLAQAVAKHVGDAIAIVVADTLDQARDA